MMETEPEQSRIDVRDKVMGVKEIVVRNLGANVSVEEISQLFHLDSEAAKGSTVTLNTTETDGKTEYLAVIRVPEPYQEEILKKSGVELSGHRITVQEVTVVHVSEDGNMLAPSQTSNVDATPTSFAMAAATTGETPAKFKYVEINTKTFNRPRNLPNTATVVLAVERSFAFDNSKTLIPVCNREGLYRIETEYPELYENITELELAGKPLAKVTIQTVEECTDARSGRTFTRRVVDRKNNRRPDELLITLKFAATKQFSAISDDMLYEAITDMGIGKVKIGITEQKFENSELLNGNKYFVLSNLQPGDKERLPNSFQFMTDQGVKQIWLGWYGKARKCKFCQKFHEGECEVEKRVRAQEKEKAAIKAKNGGAFNFKVYASSSLRSADQSAVASSIDVMSGGTLGNIINSIEIDEEAEQTQNIVIVGGANEIKHDMLPEEYL